MPSLTMTDTRYIGRFAPTPSGFLHFGSLVAALASWLDARAVSGRWLLRMEDTDPPREMPGARDAILQTLERYGLEWDGEVVFQSQRHDAYAAVVDRLFNMGLAYACTCSRKQLEGYNGIYPGFCRNAGHAREGAAIRLRVPELIYRFTDRVQGEFQQHLGREVGDFVIQRRDGLYAYQLAVVLDDAWQGVTDIVRGADLLDNTPRQLYLQELLGFSQPRYLHIPLIVQPDGHKLGKSYRSPPLQAEHATPLLLRALRALGQETEPELLLATPAEVLAVARKQWKPEAIAQRTTVPEADLGCGFTGVFGGRPVPTVITQPSRLFFTCGWGRARAEAGTGNPPRKNKSPINSTSWRTPWIPASIPPAICANNKSKPAAPNHRGQHVHLSFGPASGRGDLPVLPGHHGLVDRTDRSLVPPLPALADPDRRHLHPAEPTRCR